MVNAFGLIALAVAIVIAAYLTALSHRYEPYNQQVSFDRWTGNYVAIQYAK
jgi:hypothetical protein